MKIGASDQGKVSMNWMILILFVEGFNVQIIDVLGYQSRFFSFLSQSKKTLVDQSMSLVRFCLGGYLMKFINPIPNILRLVVEK